MTVGQVRGRIIAVAGKGGTGKTTLSAIMIKLLSEQGLSVLAVDADPPVSLTYALGAEPVRTIGGMRAKLIENPAEKRRIGDRHMGEFIRDELVLRAGGSDLLVLGQAEGAGCFCGLNELLKHGIDYLARGYEVTVIDCEAGIEQVNRRVISRLDTLVLVSDPTRKGLRTAAYLRNIAQAYGVLGDYESGLVINRVNGDVEDLEEMGRDLGLDPWGTIPMDECVAEYDRIERPTVGLPEHTPSVRALKNIMVQKGLL